MNKKTGNPAIIEGMELGQTITITLSDNVPLPRLSITRVRPDGYTCTYHNGETTQYLIADHIHDSEYFYNYEEDKLPEEDDMLITEEGIKGAIRRFFEYGGNLNQCISWIE
jgi:hypothetical protein